MKHSKQLFSIFILAFTFCIKFTDSYSQDAQFTQFYSAPLYLNPAFAGATSCWRVGLNYRNQWTFSDRPYSTYLVSVDYNLRKIKAGIGGYVLHDNPGAGGFTTFEFAPIFSKEVRLRNEMKLRFGIQPSYHLKYLTAGSYTFGDQYTNLQPIGGTADNPSITTTYNFFDISAGALLYSDKFWIGLALHHLLNNPFTTVLRTNYVPMKISLHGGMKFELNDRYETVLKPAFQIKSQGANLQADLGCYFERNQLVLGAWYRGIPLINSSAVAINQDALGLLIGLKISSLQVGYSYDMPISRMIYSFGSHELSAIFEFCVATGKRKPPRYIQQLPCPTF